MYGKFFASTFTGSMLGAGADVFAVWGYVIANTVGAQVELNPKLISAMIGMTPARVEAAIEYLCAPDPASRSKEEDGRRLVKEGAFAYLVPNHDAYCTVRNEDERRAYNRQKQAESRSRRVNARINDTRDMSTMSTGQGAKSAMSTHKEEEEDTDTEEEDSDTDLVNVTNGPEPVTSEPERVTSSQPERVTSSQVDFDQFWAAYPKKKAKGEARKAWTQTKKARPPLDVLLAKVHDLRGSRDWTKEGGRYVPHPATWLRAEGWNDEVTPELFAGAAARAFQPVADPNELRPVQEIEDP